MSENNGYKVAVITASDKAYAGERIDESGRLVAEISSSFGYNIVRKVLLSDERDAIEAELKNICDNGLADLVLTTGGTGMSPRDNMPEATAAIAHRNVPGIAQAILSYSMTVTKRAMFSRAVSVIREKTLIVNLPGSPKAVEEILMYILPELKHGLDILTENDGECAILAKEKGYQPIHPNLANRRA